MNVHQTIWPLRLNKKIIFNLVSFSFWFLKKIDVICIQSQIDKPFQLLSFWIGDLHACEVTKVLELDVDLAFVKWLLFNIWEFSFHLYEGGI
jgi:hypothetical protein